jgi:hypothetical protein
MNHAELVSYVKLLASRVDKLEKENEKLRGCVLKKKVDVIDQLNMETKTPPIRWQEWVESLSYKESLETVFREDLLTGIIEVLDRGVNKISIIDHEQLPLRVFSNKPNSFYVYDIHDKDSEREGEGDSEEEKIVRWKPLLVVDLDRWFSYMAKRFLIEFKTWFDNNEELIKTDETMSNRYVEFLQKTLGGQRMTEEGRNHRLRQHIYKEIKQAKL